MPYALGGALAYGQHGIPRATNDVDINVFLEPAGLAPAFAALREVGVVVDEGHSRREAELNGMFMERVNGCRIDVFVPSIDFSWEALRTRVRRTVAAKTVWFLSAEALTVFKLLFFRSKDLVDLERLVAIQGSALDQAYVRGKVVEMMGEDDPRLFAWDKILQERVGWAGA